MQKLFRLSFICVLLIGYTSVNAQSLFGDIKNKSYENKVNKSPAKKEINDLDESLKQIERYNEWSGYKIYTSAYKVFTKNYENAEKLIPIIKEKDPKWKIQKQEERWSPFTDKYNEAVELQEKYEELKSEFNYYEKYFKEKLNAFKGYAGACGYNGTGRMDLPVEQRTPAVKALKNYLTGKDEEDFNWLEVKSNISKFEKVIDAYKKEYEAKGGMPRDIRSNELELFTEGGLYSIEYYKSNFVGFHQKINMFDDKPSLKNFPGNLIRANIEKTAAEAWLSIFPDDENLLAIYKKVKIFSSELESKFQADIAVSDFHTSIIKGIYFSDHPVKIGEEKESDFKRAFKSTDPIYITIYSSRKYNTCERDIEIIDEGRKRILSINFPHGNSVGCVNMSSVLQLVIVPESFEEVKSSYHSVVGLLGYLKDIKEDQLTLKIQGEEIKIDLSDGTEKYKKLNDQILAHRSSVLSPPKAKMSVNISVQGACKEEGFNEALIRTIPLQRDWEYNKNSLGVTLSRETEAVLLFKDSRGKCFMREVTIFQKKIPSGYAAPFISNISNFYQQEVNSEQVILHVAEDEDYRIYCKCQ